MRKLKGNVLKIVSTSMAMMMVMSGVASAQTNTISPNEKVSITLLSENNYLIEDLEKEASFVYTASEDMKSAVIIDEKGKKSHLTIDEYYDENSGIKSLTVKIDGEITATGEVSTGNINDTDSSELRERMIAAKGNYDYKLINTFTINPDLTKSILSVASSILAVASVALTAGIAHTVAQEAVKLFNLDEIVRNAGIRINQLYSKDAPMNLQIKAVTRIYKDSAMQHMKKMFTSFRAV